MKKIAVIATTENIFKIKEKFDQLPISVDFILFGFESNYDFGELDEQSLLVDRLMIPISDKKERTKEQLQKIQGMKSELMQLSHLVKPPQLSEASQFTKETLVSSLGLGTSTEKGESLVFLSSQINDISPDERSRSVKIEFKQSGVTHYDHVLIENTDRVLEFVNSNNRRELVADQKGSSFSFVGFRFRMSDFLTNNYFWFVDDSNYESVYDNFYFVNCKNTVADIWTWIPEQQLKSSEYFRFLSDRVRNRVEKKINFLTFSLDSTEFMIQPLNPASRYRLNNLSLFSQFPHFNFLSEKQTDDLFWSNMLVLNKKIKFFSPPKTKVESNKDL